MSSNGEPTKSHISVSERIEQQRLSGTTTGSILAFNGEEQTTMMDQGNGVVGGTGGG